MTRPSAIALLLVAGCSDGAPPAPANDAAPAADSNLRADEAMPGAPAAPSSAAELPATMPGRFRGSWADSADACAAADHPSRLDIAERSLRYPTFVIVGDSFTFSARDQVAVKGHVEGTGRPIEAHFSINASGDVLTDEAGGGAIRVRCR